MCINKNMKECDNNCSHEKYPPSCSCYCHKTEEKLENNKPVEMESDFKQEALVMKVLEDIRKSAIKSYQSTLLEKGKRLKEEIYSNVYGEGYNSGVDDMLALIKES